MERSKRKQEGTLDSSGPAAVTQAVGAAREYIVRRDGKGPEPFPRDKRASLASAEAIMARIRALPMATTAVHRHPSFRVAMLAVAAVLVAAISSIATMGVLRSSGTVEVHFVLMAPDASSVTLAADFNQWMPEGHELKRDSDGRWEITIPLRKGKSYAYNFVIDGERWIVDPSTAARLEDGFGGSSSTISL